MLKKCILVLFITLLCGCTSTQKEERIYQDGTYTSTAQGYGGTFNVYTTIKEDKIEDIVVKEHNETPSIGGVAIEQMISQMKKEGKADVDIISGATKTSQGIKGAVENALNEAKNKVEK